MLFVLKCRVIRRLITMLCKQASLEASNDALSRQAAANAANADLVEKVKKEAKVSISLSAFQKS